MYFINFIFIFIILLYIFFYLFSVFLFYFTFYSMLRLKHPAYIARGPEVKKDVVGERGRRNVRYRGIKI